MCGLLLAAKRCCAAIYAIFCARVAPVESLRFLFNLICAIEFLQFFELLLSIGHSLPNKTAFKVHSVVFWTRSFAHSGNMPIQRGVSRISRGRKTRIVETKRLVLVGLLGLKPLRPLSTAKTTEFRYSRSARQN